MSAGDNFQLLDFGHGRRLERFGSVVLDRPCPAADLCAPASPQRWQEADARFEGRNEEKGQWTDRREVPPRWNVTFGHLRFELKRTDFGHLGVFPEQADNWQWLANCLPPPSPAAAAPKKILNLFAYTGGSTLAAALAGAEVVHVDAARNVVAWARRNAELSGLADAPIRWIGEDALKFVKRELKRGNRYDGVILDPPSYGHGPRGEVWRLSKHLPRLLGMCAELVDSRPVLLLLTCHTPGYNTKVLQEMIEEHFGSLPGRFETGQLSLRSANDRQLPSGVFVRYKP
mgnify:FL=1